MENRNKEHVRGYIDGVVYYNEANDYAVLDIASENGLLITAVGTLPIPCEGERVELSGYWTYHKEFGKQFVIESFEKKLPEGTEGILQYLSAHTVKGVGPVTAEKIVRRFGEDTFDVIENHPEWLADISGITMKKAAIISESFREQNGLRGVVMFCKDFMGVTEATKVYKRLGAGAIGIIKDNPYILCNPDYGISFAKADEMAMSMGMPKDTKERIVSGVEYVLGYNAAMNGHTCLPYNKLVSASATLLELSCEDMDGYIKELLAESALASYKAGDELFVMTNESDEDENYIAKKLARLEAEVERLSIDDIKGLVDRVEAGNGITYAAMQRKAIFEALAGGVMILTGGPGTGKTTVIKALISIFDSLSMKTVLAAPTGRAAKRMSEAASREAKTVHRMLEMEKSSDARVKFGRNPSNPLDERVVIVDESSMLDLSLMAALLRAMRRGSRLILIGDVNQLPSVGAGNILADLCNSQRITTVALTEIFRQSEQSLIVTNAHKINEGKNPNLSAREGDFFFVRRENERDIPGAIADLIVERLPKTYGKSISADIQVITPSKKGVGGVEQLNAELQRRINPPAAYKGEREFRGMTFRLGDKVMQTVNDYELEWHKGDEYGLGVFNGDIGVVVEIDNKEATLKVRFDDRDVEYTADVLDELELAYAITVHKSQGCEYPVVIIPAYGCPPMLMTRNLLYTAVTRAKHMVILVGRADIVFKMVGNKREDLRYTTLKARIVDYNKAYNTF